MKCPFCRGDSKVLSTRNGKDRRRECLVDPAHRFWTVEQVVLRGGQKANHDKVRRLVKP